MVAIIDNYDSFTYNLVQLVRELTGKDPIVMRNDMIDETILDRSSHIILSPGPGIPAEAGQMKAIISKYAGKIPMLGVCLGHQALGEHFGACLKNLTHVFHGRKTRIHQSNGVCSTLFQGLPDQFEVGRYHSWVIENDGFPAELIVTAMDGEGKIMAFEHATLPIFGVQFHPESIMTEFGKEMLNNFLKLAF